MMHSVALNTTNNTLLTRKASSVPHTMLAPVPCGRGSICRWHVTLTASLPTPHTLPLPTPLSYTPSPPYHPHPPTPSLPLLHSHTTPLLPLHSHSLPLPSPSLTHSLSPPHHSHTLFLSPPHHSHTPSPLPITHTLPLPSPSLTHSLLSLPITHTLPPLPSPSLTHSLSPPHHSHTPFLSPPHHTHSLLPPHHSHTPSSPLPITHTLPSSLLTITHTLPPLPPPTPLPLPSLHCTTHGIHNDCAESPPLHHCGDGETDHVQAKDDAQSKKELSVLPGLVRKERTQTTQTKAKSPNQHLQKTLTNEIDRCIVNQPLHNESNTLALTSILV